jgi:hypothetical protein
MGMDAMSDDYQIEIGVANRSQDCADDGSDYAPRSAAMRFLNHRRMSNFEVENSTRITDMSLVPEEAKSGLTITPTQAVDIANEFFINAGLSDDIAVDSVYYADNNSYYLCCARRVEDAPGTYIEGVSYGDPSDQFAPYWEYECINMLLDDDGIFAFNWRAPVAVTEVVTENAALKTFDEAMEIYEDAVTYTYVAKLQDNDIVRTYDIDLITLSLQRISEQNALGYGLLVPVWNFYGMQQDSYTGDNGETVSVSSTIMTSMLSINAIDGTIIDLSLGY